MKFFDLQRLPLELGLLYSKLLLALRKGVLQSELVFFELIGAVIESLALEERFLELEESLLLLLLSYFQLGLVDLYLPVELLILSSKVVLNALIRHCNLTDGELTILIFADV